MGAMIVTDGLALGVQLEVDELEARVVAALSALPVPFDADLGARVLSRFKQERCESFSTFKGNVPREYVGWIMRFSGGDSIVYVQERASLRDWVLVTNTAAIVSESEVQG